jgi:putative hydrolases of HD superfamily
MKILRKSFLFLILLSSGAMPLSAEQLTGGSKMDKSQIALDRRAVDFLFEMGILSRTQRSGNAFLGSGDQSVAEHSFRTAVIGFLLSQGTHLPHDPYKLLCMCLFHDAPETRTGDLSYLQQKYLIENSSELWKDIKALSPLGEKVSTLCRDFDQKESNEALLAHDADKLELLFYLKEQHDLGNPRAMEWFEHAEKRVTTPEAKALVEELKKRKADEWWKQRFNQGG